MLNQLKYNILIVLIGVFALSFALAGQASAQSTCTSRDGCSVIISRPNYTCATLDGVTYMGSTWPQSRTANLQVGQKLTLRLGGPSVSHFDIRINGVLIADNVVPNPTATVEYDVPANGTYTIVFEAYGYDPGQNFLIRCGSSIDSYETP